MKCFNLPSISLVYFKIARHFQNTRCAIKEEKWKVNQIGRKTKTFKYRFDAGKIDLFKFNYQERWDSIMRSETLFISLSSQYNQLIADESQSVEISLIFVSMILRLIRTFIRSILVYPTNFSSTCILNNLKNYHFWYMFAIDCKQNCIKNESLCFTNTLLLNIVRLHKVQCSRY